MQLTPIPSRWCLWRDSSQTALQGSRASRGSWFKLPFQCLAPSWATAATASQPCPRLAMGPLIRALMLPDMRTPQPCSWPSSSLWTCLVTLIVGPDCDPNLLTCIPGLTLAFTLNLPDVMGAEPTLAAIPGHALLTLGVRQLCGLQDFGISLSSQLPSPREQLAYAAWWWLAQSWAQTAKSPGEGVLSQCLHLLRAITFLMSCFMGYRIK